MVRNTQQTTESVYTSKQCQRRKEIVKIVKKVMKNNKQKKKKKKKKKKNKGTSLILLGIVESGAASFWEGACLTQRPAKLCEVG